MKRFTETTKWGNPWYRKLEPRLKLLWQYMLDHCDNAGVIEVDWELASFQIGEEVEESDLESFGERIESIHGSKLWICGFIEFQCGELKESCRPHQAVIKLLHSHKLSERVLNPYPKGIPTLAGRDQEKEKEQDKDTDQEKDAAPAEIDLDLVRRRLNVAFRQPADSRWTPQMMFNLRDHSGGWTWDDWQRVLAYLDAPASEDDQDLKYRCQGLESFLEKLRNQRTRAFTWWDRCGHRKSTATSAPDPYAEPPCEDWHNLADELFQPGCTKGRDWIDLDRDSRSDLHEFFAKKKTGGAAA